MILMEQPKPKPNRLGLDKEVLDSKSRPMWVCFCYLYLDFS